MSAQLSIPATSSTERERACDENVLAGGNDPQTYAVGILNINRRSIPIGTAKKVMLVAASAVAIALPFLAGNVPVYAVEMAAPQNTQDDAPANPTPEEIEQKRAEQWSPRMAIAFDPGQFGKFVGYYQLNPSMFFTVTRKEDHFFARLTGQLDVEEFPESPNKFFAKVVHAQISFISDPQGNVTELVLHQNGREQHAPRVDGAVVKAFEAAMQRHIAEGKPDPEREVLARREIAAQQKGEPDIEDMSPTLIAAAKEQWPQIQQWNRRVGKFQNMIFLHVSQQGWDIYDVTYEHGHMILSIGPLTPDHKLDGIFFQSS